MESIYIIDEANRNNFRLTDMAVSCGTGESQEPESILRIMMRLAIG